MVGDCNFLRNKAVLLCFNIHLVTVKNDINEDLLSETRYRLQRLTPESNFHDGIFHDFALAVVKVQTCETVPS